METLILVVLITVVAAFIIFIALPVVLLIAPIFLIPHWFSKIWRNDIFFAFGILVGIFVGCGLFYLCALFFQKIGVYGEFSEDFEPSPPDPCKGVVKEKIKQEMEKTIGIRYPYS